MNLNSKRLFDIFLPEVFDKHPEALLRYKADGEWKHYSPQQLKELSFGLAAHLMDEGCGEHTMDGIEAQAKVGLICFSRPNWLVVDFAVQLAGAVLVPLYPNIIASEIVNIFNEVELKICFVGDMELYHKIKAVKDQIPTLKHIYVFERNADPAVFWRQIIKPFDAELEKRVWANANRITEDNVATIIYTSGTTGRPKGVILSHKNIMSNVHSSSVEVFDKFGLEKSESLSFLPLNHILEKMVMYVYLFNNFKISFAQKIETVADDLKEVKPYLFVTVPRLLEKVYEKIVSKGRELTGFKKTIYFWALGLANRFEIGAPQSFGYSLQMKLADKLIFSKWREALGGNVKIIVVGGAACQPKLIQIFGAAGINILEGYGLTETSPVIAVNHYELENRRVGTVGPILDTVQVKISEDGEIWVKGENVMVGYYKLPKETAETFEDGWFKTGDIGEVKDGFLKITDRKKEMFKTSGGKYVAPQMVENKLKESFYIEQIMVVGEGEKFVSALIVPNFNALNVWCERNEIKTKDKLDLTKDKKVEAHYQTIIDKANVNLDHVAQIKRFILVPEEWTVESGALTPSLKVKRKVIRAKFYDELAELYGHNKSNP